MGASVECRAPARANANTGLRCDIVSLVCIVCDLIGANFVQKQYEWPIPNGISSIEAAN